MALTIHAILYWAGLALYAAAFAASLSGTRWIRLETLLIAGLSAHAASAVARGIVSGHPPIFGTFENSMAASWAVVLVTLVLIARSGEHAHPALVRAMLAWALAILVYGQFFDKTPYPLTISERSALVDVHVLFAWTAFSIMLLSATAGAVRLVERDVERQQALDRLIVRGVGLGTAAFTAMLLLGSLYCYILFADWYRWEIVGASAFATWLGYALTAHAYLMFGWRGRRIAWCVVALLPLVIAVFWSWSIVSSTYHYFEIPEIRAW